MWRARAQTLVRLVYPPLCLECGGMVETPFGLCGPCWRDTPFIGGCVCRTCGTPLPGDPGGAESDLPLCDDCLGAPPPWTRGRAALVYDGTGRRLVLKLKHGDRQDIARPAGLWMARAMRGAVPADALVVPVPLHWTRLMRRRYNQSALLAAALARELGLKPVPDLLRRTRRTPLLDGLGREARTAALEGALSVTPRWARRLAGRSVLLVDDVMTSGATLSAAARACSAAGAAEISVAVLARVARSA